MALVILLIILVFPIDYSDGDEDQWQRDGRGVVRNRIFTMMMR